MLGCGDGKKGVGMWESVGCWDGVGKCVGMWRRYGRCGKVLGEV